MERAVLTGAGGPKRVMIKSAILRLIAENGFHPGDRLPGQNELAARFQTTVVTIHRALAELEAERKIHRINGSGTFVGPRPIPRTRNLCLVLPGEHLDEPSVNPLFWPHVRHLLHAFIFVSGTDWRFATIASETGQPFPSSLHELGREDVVFFHHTKQPRAVLDQMIREGKTPVVSFGLPEPGLRCLTIDHDPENGIPKALHYLYSLGYRRILFAGSSLAWGKPWINGFLRGAEVLGLPHDESFLLLLPTDQTQESGHRAAGLICERGVRCDAVLTDSDMRAVGLIEGFRERGIRVPEDIGVMGYDGLDNATRQPPFLTTLRTPFEQMIRTALDLLDSRRAVRSPVRHLKFVGEILPGRTVRTTGEREG